MCATPQVWCTAIPLYAVMPAAIERAAEQGWTRAYSRCVQNSHHCRSSWTPPATGSSRVRHARHLCANTHTCASLPAPGRVADVGVGWHVLYFAAFMTSVEAGVYVMHRSLHDVRLYRFASMLCLRTTCWLMALCRHSCLLGGSCLRWPCIA
jgi:hypothetical protein